MRALPVLLLPLALGACIASDAINASYDRSRIQRIGVLDFDYGGRPAFGAEDIFEKNLLERGYKVVERGRLQAVIKEQNLGVTGLLSPETAKGIGKLLGVDAVILGQVTAYEPERKMMVMVDSHSTKLEPVFEKRKEKQADGTMLEVTRQVGTKTTEQAKQIPTLLPVEAEVGIAVKLVDVESGEVVWVGSETSQGVNGPVATEWIASYLVKRLSKKWVARKP